MSFIGKPPCDEGVIRGDYAASAPAAAAPRGTSILVVTILGSSMGFIDGTVVNVALAAIQSSLHATLSQIQWVVEAYSLLLSALLLTGGSLGDVFGHRKVFLAGVAIFAVSSLFCGIASSIVALLLARGVQGVGGALMIPGSLALIRVSFPRDRVAQAIGIWSAYTAITTAAGPVVGGWLVQHASWRWAFFINVPIALVTIALGILRLSETSTSESHPRLDWPGALIATCGLGFIVSGFLESSIVAGVAGLVLMAVFVLAEARVRSPMLPLSVFQSRAFSGANLLTLFLYAALGGLLFFFPLNLIQVQGYSATAAGAALLPLVLLMFILSSWSGKLIDRYGARRLLILGPLIASAGFALFSVPGLGGSYWTTFFPAAIVLGIGMAVTVAPLTTVAMTSAGEQYSGIASGVNNAVSRAAGLLAVAALGLVLTSVFNRALDARERSLPPSVQAAVNRQRSRLVAGVGAIEDSSARRVVELSFIAGFRATAFVAAGLAAASSVVALLTIETDQSANRSDGGRRAV